MDKIKEKLEKLRIDAETNLTRAEKAESLVKELKDQVAKFETENHNLSNKVVLIQEDLERSEKRVNEIKTKNIANDKDEAVLESLQRKIAHLEKQVDDKERDRKEAVDKNRSLELEVEQNARKAKQFEGEKADFEKKLEEMVAKYNVVKLELETTLKGLEDL